MRVNVQVLVLRNLWIINYVYLQMFVPIYKGTFDKFCGHRYICI